MTSKVNSGSWNIKPKLNDKILNTIERLGFKSMSPVQSAVIPLFLTNKDVLVEACTGSGKTLAFLIPILEKILTRNQEQDQQQQQQQQEKQQEQLSREPLKKDDIVSIIISPTRELAIQIQQVLLEFLNDLNRKKEYDINDLLNDQDNEQLEEQESKSNDITSLLLIGGTDIYQDILNFKNNGGNIIIGTPGRIDEFLTRITKNDQQFRFKEFEMLIFDEADRLLEMGFNLQINSILLKLPKQRRTGLFSATQTSEVKELARTGMRNPFKITVSVKQTQAQEDQTIPTTLCNQYMMVPIEQKFNQLVHFLSSNISNKKIIVYFLTCSEVDYFYKIIQSLKQFKDKYQSSFFSLHGKAPHNQRIKVFDSFSSSKNGVLLSTDLASRGLDIPNVDWVVQFDAPQDPKAFIHRIGRTARMGREGNALVFLTPEEEDYIEFLKIKKVPLKELPLDTNAKDIIDEAKKVSFGDREIMEKGVIALVSHVRAYKEHLCPYIFIFHRLNIGLLATGYALLFLPRMPEIRDKSIIEQWSSGYTKDQIEKIAYKEKKKEKQRQEKLKKLQIKKQEDLEKKKLEQLEKKRKLEQLEIEKQQKKQESSKESQIKKQKLDEEKLKLQQEDIKEILLDSKEYKKSKKQNNKKQKQNRFSDLMGSDAEPENDSTDSSDQDD